MATEPLKPTDLAIATTVPAAASARIPTALPLSLLRSPRRPFIWVLLLVMGMGGGMLLDRWLLMTFMPANARSDFRLMAQAWNVIDAYYVDRAALQPQRMAYGAISGMVDALGDNGHSAFLSPTMVKQVREATAGKLKGIGIEIQMKDQHLVVVAPLDDSPAQRAGLRPGDIILKVNGRDITGLPLGEVIKQISGPAGTTVRLTLLEAKSGRTREVTVERADIQLHPVTWERLPGTAIADLRISSFSDDVTKDLKTALRGIQVRKLEGIILDLRNNPGGILDEAVGTASQFLTHGNVLLVRDAEGKTSPVPVEAGGLAPDLPLVVLVNGGSASAAEIVAGALQDAHRATLVGETTFGTGTVLNEFPLYNGSALLLAVREWLTPDGHSFWHEGITPKIKVALAADATPLTPEGERELTTAQLQASDDQQLLRAVELLKGLIRESGATNPASAADVRSTNQTPTPTAP